MFARGPVTCRHAGSRLRSRGPHPPPQPPVARLSQLMWTTRRMATSASVHALSSRPSRVPGCRARLGHHAALSLRAQPPAGPGVLATSPKVARRRSRRSVTVAPRAQADASVAAGGGSGNGTELRGTVKGFAMLNIAALLFGSNQVRRCGPRPPAPPECRRLGAGPSGGSTFPRPGATGWWRRLRAQSPESRGGRNLRAPPGAPSREEISADAPGMLPPLAAPPGCPAPAPAHGTLPVPAAGRNQRGRGNPPPRPDDGPPFRRRSGAVR